MAVTFSLARYREQSGRDSMERASLWQSNAGTLYGLNAVYAAAGSTTATTTTQAKTVNTVQYAIGGKLFSKAATDNFWTLGTSTSNTTVAVNSFQKYLLCVDDTGAASVYEGTQSTVNAASVGWQNIVALAKAPPANPWGALTYVLSKSVAIFSVLTIATDGTHTFTPGTTALNATGITATFIDGLDVTLSPLIANEQGKVVGISI